MDKMRFEVASGCNAWYLLDRVTGREACLGDGVDRITTDAVEPAWAPSHAQIGTEEFRLEWQYDANEYFEEYFEAYFSELADLEVYDNGGRTIDRYTVLIAHYGGKSLWVALALSANPDSPQGFSLFVQAVHGDLGESINFLDLPENVQAHIARRIEGLI